MPSLIFNWRMASTYVALPRSTFPVVGLPPAVQWFARDYSVKHNNSEGGVNRSGYLRYELLWTRMDQQQISALQRVFNASLDGDIYVTGLWYDTSNPVTRWVDLKGKPDITDPTPNTPAFAYGQQVYSTIKLTLNNVVLVTDPATY